MTTYEYFLSHLHYCLDFLRTGTGIMALAVLFTSISHSQKYNWLYFCYLRQSLGVSIADSKLSGELAIGPRRWLTVCCGFLFERSCARKSPGEDLVLLDGEAVFLVLYHALRQAAVFLFGMCQRPACESSVV